MARPTKTTRLNAGLFSGQLGFVLAAVGSTVGLGNIWRFPYLAAKGGGGLFLVIYLALVLTFGFTMLAADIGIGRRTRQSPLKAYGLMRPGWGFLGKLTFLVPALIMSYYAIVGGWILKYVTVYLSGGSEAAAGDDYFGAFISAPVAPLVFTLAFMGMTAAIVYHGVEKGIEKSSRILMPALLLVIMGVALFALTLSHTDAQGVTRTGLQGLKVYAAPDFGGLTLHRFLQILLEAMTQMFFSLSIAMGIMITYGSYVKDEVNLARSIGQILLFDTFVAFLAGMMIIPTIYAYAGPEGMTQGAGLMFVSLPKVFHAMGGIGVLVALVFFVMTTFAALTSCVSVMETLTADCMELFRASRKKTVLVLAGVYAALSVVICLGYSVFYMEIPLPDGSKGQLLDLMDYLSTRFLMPIVAFLSSILIGWILGPQWIVEEIEKGGARFWAKRAFAFMIRYVCPVVMLILFLEAVGVL